MSITSDDIIRAVIDNSKRRELFNEKALKFIKMYDKYQQAWEDFKEDYSHVRCVLLERFMQ